MSISSPYRVEAGGAIREKPSRPIRLLSLFAGFTVLALICLVWNAFTCVKQITDLERRYLRIEELRGTIVHLDEVLTMSARLAAATGDTQWEARYRRYEPQLAVAIEEALSASSEDAATRLVERTESANAALVRMEYSAFDLIHHGRLEAARVTLASGEYDRQKAIYYAGMNDLDSMLKLSVPESVEQKLREVTVVLTISAVVLPLLVGCLIITLRAINRGKAALLRKSAELAELNVGLDRKVVERTSELECSRQMARLILDTAYDPFIAMDAEGRITEWNVQAGAIFGWHRNEALGRRLSETIIPLQHRDAHERGLQLFRTTGDGPILNRNIEITALHRDGHEIPVELIIWPVLVGGTTSFNAFVRDITARKQAHAQLMAQHAVTQSLADSPDLAAASSTILRAICQSLAWDFGALWQVDECESVLRCVDCWRDPLTEAADFEAVTRQNIFEPGIGIPGHTWVSGHAVWKADFTQDLNFPREKHAVSAGLHGAFGVPIILGTETLGVLEFFSREIKEPSDETLKMVTAIASQIGQYIERKRGMALLRKSDQTLRAAHQAQQEQFLELEHLYRTAPVGLELLDRDFRVIRVNELLATINGLSVDDHIGRTLREIIPQFAPQIEAYVEQVFVTGEPVLNVEVHGITRADPATERDWIVGYYPVKAQDGVPRYVGCVVLEITERKSVEVELRRNKDLLQNVIDHIPCAVFWKDRQSVCMGGNQLAANDLGFATRAEMIGMSNFDMPFPREEAESFTRFDREVMNSGKPLLHFEEVVTKPDGQRLHVLTSKVPLRGAAGEIFGVLAIYLDISDRKRAEQVLANQVTLLQEQAELLDLSHDAITVRALDGTFSFWSKGAEEMYGWTSTEAIGKISHDLFQTRFPKPLTEIDADLLQHGRWEGRLVQLCKNGSVIVVASRWTVKRNLQDEPMIVLEINTDITAEIEAQEAQFHAKEAAEAANRSKSEFLANMSHEIRTPMNGIVGMTELTLDSDLTHEQRKNLSMVKTSADSLLHLINDILDFSKIEAGKLELDPIPFALRDSLGSVVGALSQRAQEKGLELKIHVGPEVPDELIGDSLRLRQIITNLVGNAIKFTQRGEVAVHVDVDGAPAKTVGLHFTVRDTGIGIPNDKQHLIFEAFTQADSSTTRTFGGTGLGLAITSQLVTLMGGRAWVESEVGIGTTIHFTVCFGLGDPTAPKHSSVNFAASAATRTQPDVQPARQLNILLADDNVINQRVAVGLLERRGHAVQPVNNGREALEAMACEYFDLVLMDVQMPEMDGFEATAAIRRNEQETGGRIPIIAMTAHAMKGDRERCLASGMDDYLAKPVESKALDAILERWDPAQSSNDSPRQNQLSETNEVPLPTTQNGAAKLQSPTQLSNPTDVFDIAALRARVEDDLDLLAEMIDLYLSSSPLLLTELESAVAARDGDRITRAAHTLKGVLGNMCASSCAEAALRLEMIGQSGDFARGDQSLATLKHEFKHLQTILTEATQGVEA